MLAQGAVGFIQARLSMLHEGEWNLKVLRRQLRVSLADVKAIKGIWQWLIGLLSGKPKSKPTEEAPSLWRKRKPLPRSNSLMRKWNLLIKDIGEKLGLLFDTQQQINNYYRSLEEESKNVYDPDQNSSKKAIERTLIELQLEKLMEQVREAMVYAPAELKDLYSRFLKMYAKIEQEQEWARSEMIRRARIERWRQEQRKFARLR